MSVNRQELEQFLGGYFHQDWMLESARAEEVVSPQDPRQWRRLARALHQLVRDHFETFRAQAARLRDGQGLPRFVETVPDARASVIGHACEDKETAAKSCRNSRSPGPVIH